IGAVAESSPFVLDNNGANPTLAGRGGSITIQGGLLSGGDIIPTALPGAAYVQLVDNSANQAYYGGSTVMLVTSGGVGKGGAILINGRVEATAPETDFFAALNDTPAAGNESLRFEALNGSVEVTGDIGRDTPLQNLVFGCCGVDGEHNPNPTPDPTGSNGGVITFDGTVTANNIVDQRLYASPTLTTTAAIYLGAVNVANYNGATDMNDDSVAVEFKKGGT